MVAVRRDSIGTVDPARRNPRAEAPSTCLIVRPLYDDASRPALPRLADGLDSLAAVLADFELQVAYLPTNAASDCLSALTEHLVGTGPLLVYVGGHAIVIGGDHYTALRDSPPEPNSVSAIWTRQVATLMGGARRDAILLIESCFAGNAMLALEQALAVHTASSESVGFGVVATCRAYETANDGEFVEALLALMHGGPRLDKTAWSPKDRLIPLGPLLSELRATGLELREVLATGGYAVRLLPNLQEPDPPDRVHVKIRLRRMSAGAEQHFVDRSDGFVGRVGIRNRISSWLDNESQGIFVVTGSPGTGKSALMGLLARQSVGDPSATLDDGGTTLAEGTFDAILHARQKTAQEIRAELARFGSSSRLTLLVDEVDAAVSGESVGIAAHLRAFAKLPDVRMVVGTRPGPVVRNRAGVQDPLLEELNPKYIANLDETEETTQDIGFLLRRILTESPGSPYAGKDVTTLSYAVAARTSPSFLFAHTAAHWLLAQNRCITDEPNWRVQVKHLGSTGAFDVVITDDLTARFGEEVSRVHDLLRALAWAEGLGLPRYTIWPELAEAITPLDTRYGDPDITWVLNEAGWYITEDGEDGQTVYRLFHQAVIDYFRQESLLGR